MMQFSPQPCQMAPSAQGCCFCTSLSSSAHAHLSSRLRHVRVSCKVSHLQKECSRIPKQCTAYRCELLKSQEPDSACIDCVNSADGTQKKQRPTDLEQPLLEKAGEDAGRRGDSKTLVTLLRYSAADTPLLLVAFTAGAQFLASSNPLARSINRVCECYSCLEQSMGVLCEMFR